MLLQIAFNRLIMLFNNVQHICRFRTIILNRLKYSILEFTTWFLWVEGFSRSIHTFSQLKWIDFHFLHIYVKWFILRHSIFSIIALCTSVWLYKAFLYAWLFRKTLFNSKSLGLIHYVIPFNLSCLTWLWSFLINLIFSTDFNSSYVASTTFLILFQFIMMICMGYNIQLL